MLPWVARTVLDDAARRRREGTLIFTDLILWTRDLLRDDASARAMVRRRYDALLIDEFQDTDPWQVDIAEAFRWYEGRRVGLGREFVDEVDSAFSRALEVPRSFPVAYRGLRRIVLRRFPYLVYFREHDEAVQVFGVLHGRHDRRRLRRRSTLP